MVRLVSLSGLLIIALVVGALAPSIVAAGQGELDDSVVPGEVIVKLAAGSSPSGFAASAGLRLSQSGNNQIPEQTIYRFQILDGATSRGKARALASNPLVIYAEPNYLGQVPEVQKRASWVVGGAQPVEAQKRASWVVGGDVGTYASQWVAEDIGLSRAHTVSCGRDVTVAILDTGADLDHEILAGRIVSGHDFIDGDDMPWEEDAESFAFGHGTHVAGLVALAAPEAGIMPLRTLDPDGSGDLWTQILALRYAADHGASVINLSFVFGERSAIFDDVVAEVTCTANGNAGCRSRDRAGVVVVAAAGNDGSSDRAWPAASTLPGLISVAASTESDSLADFSNYGPWVSLAAPGENVLSSVPDGSYASWSGTSMATPLASGVSALVRSADPALGPAEVIRRIVSTAAPMDGAVRRRLDAAAAVGAP